MITFRNHIVTLVAVFLALAVGVVLGGGPLSDVGRGTLAASTSKAEGTNDADSDGLADFGDAFAAAGATALYDDQLHGRPVVMVTLPGAPSATVKSLTEQVEAAGGSVAGSYAAQSALVEPVEKSLVDTLGSQLVTQLGSEAADGSAPTYDRMGQLIGSAIATTKPEGSTPGELGTSIRQSLAGAELVTVPGDEPIRGGLVVVVLGDNVDDDVLAGLLGGLARKSLGLVAVGDTRSGVEGDLAALREDPLVDSVATVDGGERAAGQVTAVLALIRSLRTTGGAFGASGADGAVPLG